MTFGGNNWLSSHYLLLFKYTSSYIYIIFIDKTKQDADAIQNRLNAADREGKTSHQMFDAERKTLQKQIESLQSDRCDLEAAVNELQSQKEETERKLDELERDVMQLQAKSNSLPRISPEEMEELLAHRRQLEAIRQRLQLEGTKLQVCVWSLSLRTRTLFKIFESFLRI